MKFWCHFDNLDEFETYTEEDEDNQSTDSLLFDDDVTSTEDQS